MKRIAYPRPDFIRKTFQFLDGTWDFSFDEPTFDKTIVVPFSPECKMSGIDDKTVHSKLFYRKSFKLDTAIEEKQGKVLIHFLAVDYKTKVLLNGNLVGVHSGGYSPFSFDITDFLEKDNTLIVEVEDTLSPFQRRGKQSWKEDPFSCWYYRNSGIWQSVYLEAAGSTYLKSALLSPSYANRSVSFELLISDDKETKVHLDFSIKGKQLGSTDVFAHFGRATGSFSFMDVDITDNICWSPDNPVLIDVTCTVYGLCKDEVVLYFGLRDISCKNGQIYINRERVFLKLVLDQGIWEESLLTPPSLEALRKDIDIARSIGFNGARKHQKIESPAYYTMCDESGFLVWEELPSDYCYSLFSIRQSAFEMDEIIRRDYNHPSVMAWVPLNESWGTGSILFDKQQQEFARMLLHYIKAIDKTRLVSMNDGWEMGNETDIVGVHDYRFSSHNSEKYDNLDWLIDDNRTDAKQIFFNNERYQGQPVILSEFGGIAFADENQFTWGYFGKISSEDEFVKRIKTAVASLKNSKLAGYCYTQLTDAFQETNGLVDMKRKEKISLSTLQSIFEE